MGWTRQCSADLNSKYFHIILNKTILKNNNNANINKSNIVPFKRYEFLPPDSWWHSSSVRLWSTKAAAVNLSSHRLITEMADFMMHKATQKNWPTLVIHHHLVLLLNYWYWTEIIVRPANGTSGKQINFYILSFKTFRTLKDWLSKQPSLQRWSFRFLSFDIFKHLKNCLLTRT